jgi:hypothetical protein
VKVSLRKNATGNDGIVEWAVGTSGRARMGLIGNNNIVIQRSTDGSAWTTAITVDASTGAITLGDIAQVPAGSVSAPSLAVGEANTGLYRPSAGQLSVAVAGAQRLLFTSTDTRFDITGGGTNTFYVRGEGSTALHVRRYSTDANSPITALYKARGTINTPADVVTSDTLGDIYWYGYGGGGFRTSCRIYGRVTAATPSATDMEGRLVILLAPPASVTLTEIMRLDYDTGLSMYGSNVVVDANRHFQLRSYTMATLPSAATAGQMIYISNESGGATPAFSDGTNWRRVSDRAIVS